MSEKKSKNKKLENAVNDVNDVKEMDDFEQKMLAESIKICSMSKILGRESPKIKKFWSNGFFNGADFYRKKILFEIQQMIDFYTEDHTRISEQNKGAALIICSSKLETLKSLKSAFKEDRGVYVESCIYKESEKERK